MPIIEYIDLHSTVAGADKVYHLALQQDAEGWAVPFAYGRRGSALNFGYKTQTNTEARARSVYNTQLTIQFGKGYVSRPGVSGNVFNASGNVTLAPETPRGITTPRLIEGHLPQLLNVITEEQVQFYIDSPLWGAQEKKNGRRMAIHTTAERPPLVTNKKGQAVGVMEELRADINRNMESYLIDGEAIGAKLHAFDLMEVNGKDLRQESYLNRYIELSNFVDKYSFKNISVVPLHITKEGKQALHDRVQAAKGEGVVFKQLSASYEPGRPNSKGNQLKFKFWESGTFYTGKQNDTKRSVPLYAWSAAAQCGEFVGGVTIPPNHEVPPAGSFVEVRYLYYYPGGSLFQPQYEGVRTDCDRSDCDISKLKVVVDPEGDE